MRWGISFEMENVRKEMLFKGKNVFKKNKDAGKKGKQDVNSH